VRESTCLHPFAGSCAVSINHQVFGGVAAHPRMIGSDSFSLYGAICLMDSTNSYGASPFQSDAWRISLTAVPYHLPFLLNMVMTLRAVASADAALPRVLPQSTVGDLTINR
jgi:hypothetical protein